MTDKTMLNFRCPNDLLEAIDRIGIERYPADNKNGCDRSKTLMDVIQAGIQALTDGTVDVPVSKTESKTESKTVELTEVEAIVEKRLTEVINVLQGVQQQLQAFDDRLGKLKAR